MQGKVERCEKVEALWLQVKALSYLELKVLHEAIMGVMQEKSQAVRVELRERMAALSEPYGLTVQDVIGTIKRPLKRHPKGAGVTRFRNPDRAEEIWMGTGRKPKWLRQQLDAGAELTSFAVEQPAKEE